MGDQEYYFDEQDQQEHFVQGMYSMASSLFPINFNTFNSYMQHELNVLRLIGNKDDPMQYLS